MFGVMVLNLLHIFFDKAQLKATRLINNPDLTKSFHFLSHCRLVAYLSIFYRFFRGHCSLDIKNIIPDSLRNVQLTRSSTQSHPFQVMLPNPRTLSHKSSSFQELISFRPPYLSLPFLNPTIYFASNLSSTNLISSPYLLNFPFSAFLCQGSVISSMRYPWHYILKTEHCAVTIFLLCSNFIFNPQ